MRHEETKEWFLDFVDGTLSSHKRQEIVDHLEQCTQCRDSFNLYQQVSHYERALSCSSEEVDINFSARVMEQLDEETPGESVEEVCYQHELQSSEEDEFVPISHQNWPLPSIAKALSLTTVVLASVLLTLLVSRITNSPVVIAKSTSEVQAFQVFGTANRPHEAITNGGLPHSVMLANSAHPQYREVMVDVKNVWPNGFVDSSHLLPNSRVDILWYFNVHEQKYTRALVSRQALVLSVQSDNSVILRVYEREAQMIELAMRTGRIELVLPEASKTEKPNGIRNLNRADDAIDLVSIQLVMLSDQ